MCARAPHWRRPRDLFQFSFYFEKGGGRRGEEEEEEDWIAVFEELTREVFG